MEIPSRSAKNNQLALIMGSGSSTASAEMGNEGRKPVITAMYNQP